MSDTDRIAIRQGGAHRLEHLQRETHAVFQRAPVGVGALVRNRREELMQQVTMRGVQLDGVDADQSRAHRGIGKGLLDARQSGGVQRLWRRLAGRVRQGRRCQRQPAAVTGRDQLSAVPGCAAGCLATGVRELDRHRHGGMAPRSRQNPGQRGLRRVGPQAQVTGADASLGCHGRGLDDQESGA
jgi:hypothetical protein